MAKARRAGLGLFAASLLFPLVGNVPQALAENRRFRFPDVDKSNDAARCVIQSSAMGQANAARDSLYDLRECDMKKVNAAGVDISGALLGKGDFSGGNFKEAQLSKAYGEKGNFDDANFENAVIDRAYFNKGSFRNANFKNAVLTGSSWDDADLTGADFTDAFVGKFDQAEMCKNPKLTGENKKTGVDTRMSLGCKPLP